MITRQSIRRLVALLAVAAFFVSVAVPVNAHGRNHNRTRSPVWWQWDESSVAGQSTLVRYNWGMQATLRTSGLTPGDTVTMWIIFFSNPEECSTTPCSRPADVMNAAAGADLYVGDGVVVGEDGKATFRGLLRVGQIYGSLKDEVGKVPGVRLTDPFGSEVALGLHSHGPVQEGEILREQLSTFLGGCTVLTGNNGFATGREDMPDEVGECTTFQGSVHLPRGR